MPSAPTYAHRLPDVIHALEQSAAEWVDRRTFQEILGVSKWTAWRILKRCGAEDGPGASLLIGRKELIRQLRKLLDDGRLSSEIGRRSRVEEYLASMLQFATRNHKQIASNDAAISLLSSRFADLPPGVDLQRGELRIQFLGTEDFLQKFGSVVFALNNDFEQINAFIEAAEGPPTLNQEH